MPNLSHLIKWAICSVLLWSPLTHASRPTFERKDPDTQEKLTCEKCPPGMSMAKPCTRDTKTECTPCASEHYTQYWNYVDRCLYCSVHCNFLEVEVAPCNRTHNRMCECKPGYYAESLFCIKHSKCPPGSGVVEPGTTRRDSQCGVCPQGTFSSNHSSQEPCQSHQNCSTQGLRVSVPGTPFHNAYCTACRADKGSEEGSGEKECGAALSRRKKPRGSPSMAAVGGGAGDCYEAALDFVAFQLKSPRRLRRLYRKLTQTPPGTEKKKPIEELQVDLHSYLHQLKTLHGKKRAWEMVQGALENMKLEHIVLDVQRRFFVAL